VLRPISSLKEDRPPALCDLPDRQPSAEQIAALAQVLRGRGGCGRDPGAIGRWMDVALAEQGPVPDVGPPLEDLPLVIDQGSFLDLAMDRNSSL
jgi:hypothetical protein